MKIQIKSIFGSVLFEGDFSCIADAVTAAVKSRANLYGANLTDANLTDANLTGANLTRANLTRANLTGANLTRANLTRANLTDANLTDANLYGADLEATKQDFLQAIAFVANEVPFLRQALIDGKIDGSTYTGECACLAGTIAHAANCEYKELPNIHEGFEVNAWSPRERWFLAIRQGDTPENSKVAAITLAWIDEFLASK